jgi:hypothetical protein
LRPVSATHLFFRGQVSHFLLRFLRLLRVSVLSFGFIVWSSLFFFFLPFTATRREMQSIAAKETYTRIKEPTLHVLPPDGKQDGALSKKSSRERESILQGKHTPGSAELMVRREFNFHWAFLAGIAIIASVLFAIVWARFK